MLADLFGWFKGKKPEEISSTEKESTRRLRRHLEKNAQTLPLRRLRKQGLQSVQVIDAATIENLVTESVDQALRMRGANLSTMERTQVHDMAQGELQKLMADYQQLAAQKTEAEGIGGNLLIQVATLREEVRRSQAELEEERGRHIQVTIDAESYRELERRLRVLFQRLLRDGELILEANADPELGPQLQSVEKELEGALERMLDEIRQRHAPAAGAHSQDGEKVGLLEARVLKLNEALASAEDALAQMARLKMYDQGVASIYDSIQGLDSNDPRFERKGALLEEVFLQNLVIQGIEESPEAALASKSKPKSTGLKRPKGFATPVDPIAGETAF